MVAPSERMIFVFGPNIPGLEQTIFHWKQTITLLVNNDISFSEQTILFFKLAASSKLTGHSVDRMYCTVSPGGLIG